MSRPKPVPAGLTKAPDAGVHPAAAARSAAPPPTAPTHPQPPPLEALSTRIPAGWGTAIRRHGLDSGMRGAVVQAVVTEALRDWFDAHGIIP